jgi:hypothetical protein
LARFCPLESSLRTIESSLRTTEIRLRADIQVVSTAVDRKPDLVTDNPPVGFGKTRIHAETATFELRASEVENPRPGDQLKVGGETFIVQGEPERRDPDRLVWTLDVRLP